MNKSISDIKKYIESIDIEKIPDTIEHLKCDEREGVKKIVNSYTKKYNSYKAELSRLESMLVYEKSAYQKGAEIICGVDEAGRGPLAGPVAAGAVILKKDSKILYLNDSKKLSAKKREELYSIIKDEAVSYSVSLVSPDKIDELNILKATYMAMKNAIDGLSVKPDYVLADAVTVPDIDIKQESIIHGDGKSLSIAAASIMAKVTRDAIMDEYDKLYPQYGFAKNKGYGTAEHIDAIKKYGICPIHRHTFVKNFIEV